MTVSEKYCKMNNAFCQLRDAIYESDVDEKEEPKEYEKAVETALLVLIGYFDFYKVNNKVKTKAKESTSGP